ncbi:MAG: 50S ribosomal protein L10 [Planctomycetota bacterium]|jgi:large subunit ribosomal protein L10|nr:50S ribosomal protein L10 [Blastopirellula sp.]
MSKLVKGLVADDIKRRLNGVQDCVVGNMVGLNSELTAELRKKLRDKKIGVLVIKNSLARLATKGTNLGPAFEGLKGTAAVLYGGEDFISLVKEVTGLDKDEKFAAFKTRGGVMDGERLSPEKVAEISKWPNRQEQLSMLVGQILGPGRKLGAQIIAPAGKLASQIEQAGEKNG